MLTVPQVPIPTDPKQAIDEIDYLLAEQSPAHFGAWVSGGAYQVPRHIEYISDEITPLLEKGNARIILCAPPRHGKSEFVNNKLCGWYLWKNPARRIILTGHNATFAATWGRKVRDLLCENVKRLGVKIRGGFDAAMGEWYTPEGGGMRCAGVGVGIVGLGADLFIIDDPTPDSKAAYSSNHQQELIDWFTGVVDRRLEPGASIIVSMQRWPGNDFVSWLTSMKDQGKEDWVLIRLTDIYDIEEVKFGADPLGRDPNANNGQGEALWPERWPLESMLHKKRSSDDITFYYAQYRQRPPDKSREGLAYSHFSPDQSTVEYTFNPGLPILWGMDFNVDPMCSVLAQMKPVIDEQTMDPVLGTRGSFMVRRIITVFDELYERNSSTAAACDAFAKKIKPLVARIPYFEVVVFGDASGHRRHTTGSPDYVVIKEKLKQEFGNKCKVLVKAPVSNPRQRDRVTTTNNAFLNSVGVRNMFVTNACRETRLDLLTMKWHRDGNGNPTADLDDSNPMRGHISDALGYLVHGVAKMAAPTGEHSERLI